MEVTVQIGGDYKIYILGVVIVFVAKDLDVMLKIMNLDFGVYSCFGWNLEVIETFIWWYIFLKSLY